MNWKSALRDLLLTSLAVTAIAGAVYCVVVLPKKVWLEQQLVASHSPATDNGKSGAMPDTVPAPTAAARGKIIFLHHSAGQAIWDAGVPEWFARYNADHGTNYQISEQAFPKDSPYGWQNYPYDYWNIWVKHAGPEPFKEEPTLEMLTRQYEVIVFKHCFPVSDIGEDADTPDINSPDKTLANYELQYAALRAKMRQFPQTKFIVWTGAAQVQLATSVLPAARAKNFARWVREFWDNPGDNIYVWDFRRLETEGGLYLLDRYAAGRDDSHPNRNFAGRLAKLLGEKIVNVISGNEDRWGPAEGYIHEEVFAPEFYLLP